jgi:hypothetical protein
MNSKVPKSCNRNFLIFFAVIHFLIWLIMCSSLGWLGIVFGFMGNCVVDSGLLLTWIWREKKQPYRKIAIQHSLE